MVKPLMRARGWKVGELTEFVQPGLLGLNINRGQKICLRLRQHHDSSLFLPIEQAADTMLHELVHNVHGPHDAKFNALWDQLRDELLSLTMKGYTGEGFLSEGHRLGGRTIPMDEARRLARVAAEKRRTVSSGSGQRLGGTGPQPGQDIRRVIGDVVEQRNRTLRGCANNNQTQDEIFEIANTATRNGFRTKAEEDAANDAAIAQALWEIVQEEEMAKKGNSYTLLGADSNTHPTRRGQGSIVAAQSPMNQSGRPGGWTCGICTLNNPASYLCCDACGTERTEQTANRRPTTQRTVIDLTGSDETSTNRQLRSLVVDARRETRDSRQAASQPGPPVSRTWTCHSCGRVRDSQWWSCDLCGTIKLSS
ncbi:hypothetical protein NPX13_g3018 [Xylaria arbuscula]|uniref:WLM domain-containing protein n=1 Tax=Xylaria arbuscula TaxID=114810 RepID=A0A9W8TPS3_9PEZI|nr:hypothetical protein NPX13_g3018 [Xylaria arbuscula]